MPTASPSLHIRAALTLALGTWVCTSCKTHQVLFEEEQQKQQAVWIESLETQATIEEGTFTWKAALESLRAKNIEILKSRAAIEDAKTSSKRVWKSLLPALYLQSTHNTELQDIDQLALDQFTFRLNGFINISGLLKFHPRLVSAKLAILYSNINFSLREREQAIELYRLFLEAQNTETEFAQLLEAEQFLGQNPGNTTPTARMELRQQKARLEAARKAMGYKLSKLTGDYSKAWVPDPGTLPPLEYGIPEDPAKYGAEHFGDLETKLYALEIIRAEAQTKRLAFRRWPDFNLMFSGPPIYQRTEGESVYWSAEEVRMNAWAFWNFDAQGQIRSELKSKRRLHAIKLDEIQQTRSASARKLVGVMEHLETLETQSAQIEEDLANPALEATIREALRKEKAEVERQIQDQSLLLLFFDNDFANKLGLEEK